MTSLPIGEFLPAKKLTTIRTIADPVVPGVCRLGALVDPRERRCPGIVEHDADIAARSAAPHPDPASVREAGEPPGREINASVVGGISIQVELDHAVGCDGCRAQLPIIRQRADERIDQQAKRFLRAAWLRNGTLSSSDRGVRGRRFRIKGIWSVARLSVPGSGRASAAWCSAERAASICLGQSMRSRSCSALGDDLIG